MKLLDRYIISSIAAAFLFGIAMFMGLLMAMDLMRQLVELIAEKGVPAGTALTIFAYRIPSMLAYAFPMSVLLSILLVFNRMSSESEMVAIRAAGASFLRIALPTLGFALLVTGATFIISDIFAPFASHRAAEMTKAAVAKIRDTEPIAYLHQEQQQIAYVVVANNLDIKRQRMYDVSLSLYSSGEPYFVIYADWADWKAREGRWIFHAPTGRMIGRQVAGGISITPNAPDSTLDLEAFVLRLRESPFDLAAGKKKPEEYSSRELRSYLAHMRQLGMDRRTVGEWQMGLAQRFSVPFSCLVFALIGAPLGLRHHRTSSAIGLGISLLVIFGYYSFSVYMNTFGENGRMPAELAAWLPNIVGAVLGAVLIYRANK